MANEVDSLREQVHYVPVRRSAIGEVFADVELVAESIVASPSAVDGVRRRLRGRQLSGLLGESYEAITLLVGSELDLASSGARGLGRTTTDIPRFAAAFRPRLSVEAVDRLGPLMEDLCIAGFAAAAVVDVIGRPEASVFRSRPLDVLIEQWLTRGVGVWSDWPDEVLAVVAACCDRQLAAFRGAIGDYELVRGVRRRRDRGRTERSAFMLVAAGGHLLAAHAASNDDWYD